MLKLLLRAVQTAAGEWPDATASGKEPSWNHRVWTLGNRVNEQLRHALVSDIEVGDQLTETEEQSVFQSRFRQYHRLRPVWELYRNLIERPTTDAVRAAIQHRHLVPLDPNVLFELWALLKLGEVLESLPGCRLKLKLVGDGGPIVVNALLNTGVRIRVWYQGLPKKLRKISRYRKIVETALHGSGNNSLRPDMIIRLRLPSGDRHIVVEVKRTRKSDTLRRGIVQTLGYIYDYGLQDENHDFARGLVLSYAAGPAIGDGGELILANADGYVQALTLLINRHVCSVPDNTAL